MDEEFSKLLTINTLKGLFKFNRLPFGLKVAPNLFQYIMDTMLAGLEFVVAYLDDILIKSENYEKHKKYIKAVFQKIDEYGFILGSEKYFFMEQIMYLGQIINENGRRHDLERAKTIENMPAVNNVTKLQVFLGLDNYYSIYIPKMYDLKAPLNNLLKKKGTEMELVKKRAKKLFRS